MRRKDRIIVGAGGDKPATASSPLGVALFIIGGFPVPYLDV